MSKIFITGATGFLGSNLAAALVKQGHSVTALVLPGTTHPSLKNLDIDMVEGDLLKPETILPAMKGCDQVYHLAGLVSFHAQDFDTMYNIHVLGTRNILAAAKKVGVKKIVYTSSTAALGFAPSVDQPLDEHTQFDARQYKHAGYMYTKWLAEQEVVHAAENGLNVSIVVPTSILGQGDYLFTTGKLFRSINQGKMKFAPPGGESVVSIDDIVKGHQLVMEKGKRGRKYIFSHEYIDFKTLFNMISDALGRPGAHVHAVLPHFSYYVLYPLAFCVERLSTLFGKRSKLTTGRLEIGFNYRAFDATRARKELGWKPRTSVREAVGKEADFYKKYHLL